jgi:hypothetical protein
MTVSPSSVEVLINHGDAQATSLNGTDTVTATCSMCVSISSFVDGLNEIE